MHLAAGPRPGREGGGQVNSPTSHPPFTSRFEPVPEGPPRGLVPHGQPARGRAFVIYRGKTARDFARGYRPGWYYFRRADDWALGPRSAAFPTAGAALLAAWASPLGPGPAGAIPNDPVDDDGGESSFDPLG